MRDEGPERQGGVFIGRERELIRIRALLAGLRDGAGGALLISGEPGVGKTWLLTEAGARGRDLGIRVLNGGCTEGEWQPPFALWADVLGLTAAQACSRARAGRRPACPRTTSGPVCSRRSLAS